PAPQEKRQARRKLLTAQPVDTARTDIGGRLLDPEQKLGVSQHARQRVLDALLEAAVLVPELVHLHQAVEIGLDREPADRLAREAADDLPRTVRGLGRLVRVAAEDRSAARRHGEPRRLDRTEDLDPLDLQHGVLPGQRSERVELAIGFGERAMQERDDDLVLARLGLERNVLQARIDLVDGFLAALVELLEILAAADVELKELPAVDRRDQRVHVLLVDTEAARDEIADAQQVLAVGGEVMPDGRAAPRAERQPFDIRLLPDGRDLV